MIHLVKNNIPNRFYTRVKEKPEVVSLILSKPNPWTYFGGRFVIEKMKLKSALLKDSGYVCIYCGIRVTKATSRIEHIMCKSVSKLRVLDDKIMGISCNGGENKEEVIIKTGETINSIAKFWGISTEILQNLNPDSTFRVGDKVTIVERESRDGFHCDKSKGDLLIHYHPLKKYCHQRLAYNIDELTEEVEITSPYNEERVFDAINKLNLNNELLKSLRYSIIDDIEESLEEIVDLELPKEEEKLKIIELYMQYATLDSANQYAPYYFVGLYHLEEYYKRYN